MYNGVESADPAPHRTRETGAEASARSIAIETHVMPLARRMTPPGASPLNDPTGQNS